MCKHVSVDVFVIVVAFAGVFCCYRRVRRRSLQLLSLLPLLSMFLLLFLFFVSWCYSECISTPGKLKNLPDHRGNRTHDLWFAESNAPPTELRGQVGSSM